MTVTLVVNGHDFDVPGDGRPTLLDALRDGLDVTGPKLGCGEGAAAGRRPADIKVVLTNQQDQPSAGGETPIIAVAPAIANAIDRASGVRLRSMPMIQTGRLPRSGG